MELKYAPDTAPARTHPDLRTIRAGTHVVVVRDYMAEDQARACIEVAKVEGVGVWGPVVWTADLPELRDSEEVDLEWVTVPWECVWSVHAPDSHPPTAAAWPI